MNRTIMFFENHFIDFYNSLQDGVQEKIDYVLYLIKNVERIPVKFLKHIECTNGLYELRIKTGSDIFRIFCCFDEGKLVILFNGFQKKSQKTPKSEIRKAEKLKEKYFNDKKKGE
ncbi:MAG: hypothetical protein SCALA702_00950 [Melioribacteraceae bacterium]|nr:MAG: hypothetical protein SCALA702_00950 [Melioribacteraceae bacterium]